MKKIAVKTFKLGDVEDPEIYLGAAAYEWMQSDHGLWCKEHAIDLVYHQSLDHNTMGYKYTIVGKFSNEDALFYELKWS